MIPPRYTCDGADISPPLTWNGQPEGTKSLAIICYDPDAPSGTWVHWIYYNIPPDRYTLPEGISKKTRPQEGGIQGINDFREIGYNGPCPPKGIHRYFFELYALDELLDLREEVTMPGLMKVMRGHILGKSILMGRYERGLR